MNDLHKENQPHYCRIRHDACHGTFYRGIPPAGDSDKTFKSRKSSLRPLCALAPLVNKEPSTQTARAFFYLVQTAHSMMTTVRLSSGSEKRLLRSPSATIFRRSFEIPYLSTSRS